MLMCFLKRARGNSQAPSKATNPTTTVGETTAVSSGSNHDMQESYIAGLMQQIKLQELEISYLKQHPPNPNGNNTGPVGGGGINPSSATLKRKASTER